MHGGIMSNDYLTEPPPATSMQIVAALDGIGHLQRDMSKLVDVPQKLDRLVIHMDQLNKDQLIMKQETDERFRETNSKVAVLSDSKTSIDSVVGIAKWCGVAFIGALVVLWNTQTAKTDMVNSKSSENMQRIIVIEKQQDHTARTLEEIRNKMYSLKEARNESN